MSRKDKLTRQLSYPERRKRRNLSDFPRVQLGTAVPDDVPPGGCPNIGPTDAAAERITAQDTAEVSADPYEDVQIAATGLIPGADVISYCFEAKVGPPGGPVDVSCDGKLALTVSGLVHSDLIEGALPDGASGFWGRWDKEIGLIGGHADLRYDAVTKEYWVELWPATKSKVGVSIISKITQDFPRDNWSMQAKFRRVVIGSGSGLDVGVGIVMARKEALGIFDEAYGVGHFGGFVGSPTGIMFRYTAGTFVDLGQEIQAGDGLTGWVQDDEQEGYYLIDQASTGTPHVKTDAVNKDTVGGCGVIVCKGWYSDGDFTHPFQAGQFQDIYICKRKPILLTGIPTGWYAKLVRHDGETNLTALAESGGTVTFPSRTDGGLEYWRWPFAGFQIFDDDPTGAGVLQLECHPARGVFPGDTWNYSGTGDQETGDSTLDAQATIRLEIFDVGDNLLAFYEPTGGISEAYARTANTEYLDIAVPFNAAYFRFTPWKRGAGDAWAAVKSLQVNTGGNLCCEFTVPGEIIAQGSAEAVGLSFVALDDVVIVDVDGDGEAEPHVTQVYDEDRSDGTAAGAVLWTGGDIGDGIDEHRESSDNLMGFDGQAEQDGPGEGTAGAPLSGCGYLYDPIDLEEFAVDPGDPISIRFKGKVV